MGIDERGSDGQYSISFDMEAMHDLREGLTLTKGWLEALFRGWEKLDDARRREMVSAALLGANQLAFVLEQVAERGDKEIRLPHERMAEEFLRLIDQ